MGFLDIGLRLTIWFLLTADLSPVNVAIGVVVAFLIPRSTTKASRLKSWLKALWRSVLAIPQAYIEAIEIILRPHLEEECTLEQVSPRRTPGLIFLDIFIITFTPKSIVTQYHQRGWYEVHWIRRHKPTAIAGEKPE